MFYESRYEGESVFLNGAVVNGVKYGTIVSVEKIDQSSVSFSLHQNYPNPFNSFTILEYSTAAESRVVLKLFDVLGREILELIDQNQNKGTYRVTLEAGSLSSGIYILVLRTNVGMLQRKIILLR